MSEPQVNVPEVNASETIRRVLRVCKKGRWLVVLATVISVVGANVGLHFVPNKYRSDATILFADQQYSPSIVTPLSNTPLFDRLEVAARDVLSQPKLREIFTEVGLLAGDTSPDDTVESLGKNIDIELTPPYAAFRISFTAKTPQLAQDVTKKLTELFIKTHLALQADRVQTATGLIDEQLAQRRLKLNQLEERMVAFRGQYAGELENERPENQEDLRQAQLRLENLTASRDRANEQRALLESTLVASLNTRLTRLQDEQAALLKHFTAKHPDVVSKDNQIAQVQAEMEELKTRVGTTESRQNLVTSADPGIALLEGQLKANALEIDGLSREASRQTALIAEYKRRMTKNPVHEQELSTMSQDSKELNDEIADLERKQQQSGLAASMESRADQQEFRLVDPPSFPTHPSSKKRQQASLGALVAGPLVGLVFAFLLDLRKPTFQNENELRRAFAPPLVLSIPVLETPREQRAGTWRIAIELVALSIITIAIAAAELYAYRQLS